VSHRESFTAKLVNVCKRGQVALYEQSTFRSSEYLNGTLYGLLRSQNPDAVAIRAPMHLSSETVSFGEIIKLIQGYGNLKLLNVEPGDLVAYMTPYGPIGAVAFLAFGSQTTVAPLDPNFTAVELEQALVQLQAKVLISFDCLPQDVVVTVTERCNVRYTVATTKGSCGLFRLSNMNGDGSNELIDVPPMITAADQTLFIVRTSGTTSIPKIVPQINRAVVSNARLLASSLHLNSSDIALNAMPLFHVGGIYANLLGSLSVGGSVICLPAFNGEIFANILIQTECAPTWYSAVPTIHQMVLDTAKSIHASTGSFAHSLRFIRSGAAMLSDDLAHAMREFFGCPIIPTYAMSEQMPITQCPPTYALDRPGTVGVPVGVSVCIINSSLRVLPYDLRGEICISGPNVCLGYRNNEAANNSSYFKFAGKTWFRTGDVGYLDKDGFVYITGRQKELIKRGGEQISPSEVEDAICRYLGVSICVVFAVTSALWGQEVGAAVVLTEDMERNLNSSSDESKSDSSPMTHEKFVGGLKAFCLKQGLNGFKVPQYVVIVKKEQLPKTSTNKYIRIGLSEKLGIVEESREAATNLLKETRVVPISPAIGGCRVFLGFWIMYNHIGRRDHDGLGDWYDGRGWCSHVPAFIVLSGFMLAASCTAPMIAPGRLLKFYETRFLGIYPMYLVSILVAIFTFLFYCRPDTYIPEFTYGSQEICQAPPIETNWGGSFFFTVASYVLGLQAWPFIIPLSWFLSYYSFYNSIYYFLILIFPFLYRPLLAHVQDKQNVNYAWKALAIAGVGQAFFEILHGMYWPIRGASYEGAGYFSLFMYLFPPFWLPLFAIGVIAYSLFEYYRPFARSDKWKWGVLTDFFSLIYIMGVLLWIEDSDEANPSIVKLPQDHRYWAAFISRLISPMTCLWILGLAVGEGYTAKFIAQPLFSEILGPPFYCVYLFHQVISQWYYYGTRGEWAAVPKPFYWFSPVAVPVPLGEFWLIVVIVIAISFCLERFLHPWLVRKSSDLVKAVLHSREGKLQGSVVDIILQAVSNIVGHELTVESNLIYSGLGSLTTIVLVAELKSAFDVPITASDIYGCATVQDLVNFIEIKIANHRTQSVI
jgi:acyl-CoA synthetase (AMP-forming)/AMP-acid ligase II/acyl carrier protein